MVLFTGKGGVGKTTSAAASGMRLADRGVRTLLLSADPAHSLGDVLGCELGDDPVAVAPQLHAAHLDTQRRFELGWGQLQQYLRELIRRAGVDPVTSEELTVLPGVDAVLALLAVRQFAETGDYDAVIVDCAPSAQTLRLLALPDALSWYLRTILATQCRTARGLRPLAAVLGQASTMPPEGLMEAVLDLSAELAAVRALLERAGTVRLVLTPESMVVAETRRTYTALSLYGYRVDGVIANRLVPSGRDAWRSGWARSQAERMAEVAASFAGLPLYRAGYAGAEPLGGAGLRAFADELYGRHPGLDPLDAGPDREPLSVVADGEHEYELSLRLPLAVRGAVQACRAEDDLVLTLGSHRRVMALPSVLRRCQVVSGRLDEGSDGQPAQLRVRFRRDPARWPMQSDRLS